MLSAVGAFQVGHKPRSLKANAQPQSFSPFRQGDGTPLMAKKNAKKKEEVEEEELTAARMFVAYMTPWRNPNSGFVYLLLALYFLGKVSEARHVELYGPY